MAPPCASGVGRGTRELPSWDPAIATLNPVPANKPLHAFVRLMCLLTATFIIMIFNAQRLTNVLLHNDVVADVTFQWFFYYSVPVILLVAIFESFWFRRTAPELRPLAIDWFFVLGYLAVWGFGMIKGLLQMPIF
jgi:hypothetical protein